MDNEINLPSGKNPPKSRSKKAQKEQKMSEQMLRRAVLQVTEMLCEAAQERDFFISDTSSSKRRLDTKALKEFASVLKEVCSVIMELGGEGEPQSAGVRIEFSDEALGYSS